MEEKPPARPRRPKVTPPPEAESAPEPAPMPEPEPVARPRAAAATGAVKDRALPAVKKSGGRLLGALRALPKAVSQGLIHSRPGVINVMTARPYIVLVAVVLISVFATLLVVRVVGGGGTDYGSMQKMMQDIKDSKGTDWSIRSATQTIDGTTFHLTKVASDRVCFESQPSLVWKQNGCIFYSQVVIVLPVDTQ